LAHFLQKKKKKKNILVDNDGDGIIEHTLTKDQSKQLRLDSHVDKDGDNSNFVTIIC